MRGSIAAGAMVLVFDEHNNLANGQCWVQDRADSRLIIRHGIIPALVD